MMSFLTLVTLSIAVFSLFYLWCRRNHSYWRERNIFAPRGNWLLGHLTKLVLRKYQVGDLFNELYFKYKDLPYFGIYMIQRPTLMVNDLSIVKNMMIKDFMHFTDHIIQMHETREPLAQQLFNLTGETWRNLRVKFTPVFTSSKMKFMFETVLNCTKELEIYLDKQIEKRDNILNFKEVYSLLNINIIGSCAFGIECNCFNEPNNIFKKMGQDAISTEGLKSFFPVLFLTPGITKRISVSFFGKKLNNFFCNLVTDTIAYRKENNVLRNDFLHLLMQLKDEDMKNDEIPEEQKLTTWQLAAQAFVFFLAGFEPTSTTASFALYELALNPDVQDTLREDIESVLEQNDGKITYGSISKMTYLNNVLEETLRLYPPVAILFRMCTKDYEIPGSNFVIEKDTPVIFPIFGFHKDPKYFPDPDKFDPERFSPENKASRDNFAYLPFGEGPRFCIGNRFALMAIKVALLTVILNYKVSVCSKTSIPLEYDNTNFVLSSKNGIWLKVEKIRK